MASGNYSLFDFVTGAEDTTQHPDFSAAGAPIDFGFANRFNLGTGSAPFALDGVVRFDNISIRLAGVLEPSEIALMFLGLAASSVSATRRKRAPDGAGGATKR